MILKIQIENKNLFIIIILIVSQGNEEMLGTLRPYKRKIKVKTTTASNITLQQPFHLYEKLHLRTTSSFKNCLNWWNSS